MELSSLPGVAWDIIRNYGRNQHHLGPQTGISEGEHHHKTHPAATVQLLTKKINLHKQVLRDDIFTRHNYPSLQLFKTSYYCIKKSRSEQKRAAQVGMSQRQGEATARTMRTIRKIKHPCSHGPQAWQQCTRDDAVLTDWCQFSWVQPLTCVWLGVYSTHTPEAGSH